jgi:RNA ligase (TIGR02306 family)
MILGNIDEKGEKMNITYQRDVSHCEVTTYVQEVTISDILPANNSDNLELLRFKEIAWDVVVRKDMYKVGDTAMFIPPDSVIPFELSELANVTTYLSKGRVRVAVLRGNRSCGLLLQKNIVESFLPYIMKWEDPPTVAMQGDALARSEINPMFNKFYEMPNILNKPYTFRVGERIVIKEKIHGTNQRFAILEHPVTGEMTSYVGSHNVVLKENKNNLYWKMFRGIKDDIPSGYVFFGEVFGPGVQHLSYGRKKTEILLFASMKNGVYLGYDEFVKLCKDNKLPYIKGHVMKFESVEALKKLADSPSEYTNAHEREGIVIVSLKRPNVMAKCIGFEYLNRKNRKERH